MKLVYSLIISLIIFGFSANCYSQNCILPIKTILNLTESDEDEKETALMPCFEKEGNDFRRNYGKNTNGTLHYDIVSFRHSSEMIVVGEKIEIYTTNSSIFLNYKSAFKTFGFIKDMDIIISGGTSFKYNSYRMITGDTKNRDGTTVYYIVVYKEK